MNRRAPMVAGLIAAAVFVFLHFPHWGIGLVLAFMVEIAVAVAFFAWRRDLLANITAHVVVDSAGP